MKYIFCCTGNVSVDGMWVFFRLRCCSRTSLDPLCSHSLTAEPPPDAAALLSYRLSPLQTGYFQLASLLLVLVVVVVVVASWVLVCVCWIPLWERILIKFVDRWSYF